MRGELLLHCCCAPDGTVPQEILAREGWEVTLHFFGGNIHPREEYLRRAEAVLALGRARGVPVVLDPYEPEAWFVAVAPWAGEPEGGRRCLRCFALQLAAAGAAAARRGCGALCTSLTISPHKDPQVINALISGQVQLALLPPAMAAAQARGGKLRVIGLTSASRSTLVPEYPSLAEAGVKDFNLEIWNAVAAPKSMPPQVVARLSELLAEIARRPEIREKLFQQGWQVTGTTAEGLARRVQSDAQLLGDVGGVLGGKPREHLARALAVHAVAEEAAPGDDLARALDVGGGDFSGGEDEQGGEGLGECFHGALESGLSEFLGEHVAPSVGVAGGPCPRKRGRGHDAARRLIRTLGLAPCGGRG